MNNEWKGRLIAFAVYVASFGGWYVLGELGFGIDIAVPVILVLIVSIWLLVRSSKNKSDS